MSAPAPASDCSERDEQRKLEKLFVLIFIVGGGASSVASLVDSGNDLFTAWDNYGTALTSLLYFVSGLLVYRRPQWLSAALLLSAIPTAIYQQGVMAVAVHYPGTASLYSASSSGAFFPLFYLVLFIMLPRGAATLSAIHCAGFYVQFILNATLWADPLPSPQRHQAEHLLLEAMMAHPVYIVALSYIVKLRERLHAAQQQAFKSKEGFIGVVSHEIRNQLQTMVGAIELLDLKVSDRAARRSLDRLQAATTQLQTYLGDINELTTLEDPEFKVETSRFALLPLLDEIRDEWLPQAQAQGLLLSVEAAGVAAGVLIDSDQARLRQIVANLVSNAIKYTAQGGVTIAASICAESAARVTIAVSDSGIGIEAKYLDRLAEPHLRLDNAKRFCANGSGLGLSIAARLAGSLGGVLSWRSELNRGSVFSVTLPGVVGMVGA